MYFFITVSVLVVSANAILYTDCGSEQATVQKVSVSGCAEDAKECVLKRNTNATFSIEFTPTKEVNQVETLVIAVIMDVSVPFPVPFPVPKPDACMDTDSGLTCPLAAGQVTRLQTIVPIEQDYLQTKLEVKWYLLDEYDNTITCIMFSAKIE